jgi:ABC-type uncharacterized transport system fused permease/ATPase subunit
VIIPRYFAREITLGSIMQLTMSFTKVRVGFAWFVFQYKRLTSLRAMCHRLSELYHQININVTSDIVFDKNKDIFTYACQKQSTSGKDVRNRIEKLWKIRYNATEN